MSTRKKVSSESRDRLRGLTLQSKQFRKKTFAYYPPVYNKVEKDDGSYEYEFAGYEEDPIHVGVRQPTVRERNKMINQCRNKDTGVIDELEFVILCAINLAYDPESGENLYEKSDYDSLVNQPAGDFLDQLGELAVSMLTQGEVGNGPTPTDSSSKTSTAKQSDS